MSAERKKELAQQVVDLTVMNRVRSFATVNNKSDPEMAKRHRMRMRDEQVALYIKHYEIEQLLALLDFYSSDIGESILESQKRVSDELASGIRLVSGEVIEDIPGQPSGVEHSSQQPED